MPDFLADVLSWPKSYLYAVAVETAMNNGVPPTVFVLPDKQPSDGWSNADKKLAMAWTILQRETCKVCGNPIWICRSSNKDLLFSVRKGVCYADAEFQKWEKRRKDTPKPGEHAYTVPRMRLEEDYMPSRREYLDSLDD